MTVFYINPVNLIQTMTMALDLAVDGVSLHQKRTAVICSHLCEHLGLDIGEVHTLLSAALMHDIGAASNTEERRKIADPRLDMRRQEIFEHAELGYNLLRDADFFQNDAVAIRHHHDNWDGGNPSGLSGANIPLLARVIHLADRVELSISKTGPMLHNCQRVQNYVRERSGANFDPGLVDVFLKASAKECFWLDLISPDHAEILTSKISMGITPFSIDDMLRVAEIFATIIDRMSRFTATHSRSVSGVAVFLAKWNGFSQNEIFMMRIAGLLHDLGKLAIPNFILEKPGPLTVEEQLIVRQHTYFTYLTLSQINQLQTVAEWAAWHHETMDGNGYPFGLAEPSLSLGARIMAVADIFVALDENRPYRKKLPKETIQRIMKGMVDNRKISGRIVESLFDNFSEAELVVQTMELWAMTNQVVYQDHDQTLFERGLAASAEKFQETAGNHGGKAEAKAEEKAEEKAGETVKADGETEETSQETARAAGEEAGETTGEIVPADGTEEKKLKEI
ncbi:MAG: HD domain-containing protein [Deltaproteobacteria bacterium]|jgi:putative nucleotidyltransferase with HDIG domain|nr:HD domain-containing protein [Deltaproteobacteria bacterium]